VSEKFDLDKWLLELESEEAAKDPHYSLYFNPEHTEELEYETV
jgi:hypothetical protein